MLHPSSRRGVGLRARRIRTARTHQMAPPSMAKGSNFGFPLHSCTTHPSSNTALVITSEKNMPSPVGTRFTGTKLLPKKTHATKHAKYPTASS